MAAKTVALRQLLALKFPSVPGGMRREHITKSHRAEQWAHVQKFNYCLVSIEGIVLKVESYVSHGTLLYYTEAVFSVLKNCSVERLSRLSTQQLEIANQEKSLDLFFELLKQSRLDENTSTDNLDRIVNFFEVTRDTPYPTYVDANFRKCTRSISPPKSSTRRER